MMRMHATFCRLLAAGAVFLAGGPLFAEASGPNDDPYAEVALSRATRLVDTIDLAGQSARREEVIQCVAGQYIALHRLHGTRDAALAAVRETLEPAFPGAAAAAARFIEAEMEREVRLLHIRYVASLSSLLTPGQVDAVKDGMTYGVAPNTYAVYLEMVPDLDEDQKARILAWLLEAREHAMDAGSSDEKHKWFGKYKGRINNYLSSLGVDLKQAERDMWNRKQAEQEQ